MEKTTDSQHKQTTTLINKLEVVRGMDIVIIVQRQQQLVAVLMATIKVHLVTARIQKVNKDISLILDDDGDDDSYTTHNRRTSPYNDFEHYNHLINISSL